MDLPSDDEIIKRMRDGDETIMGKIYSYKIEEFQKWALKIAQNHIDDSRNEFLDAITIFYEKVRENPTFQPKHTVIGYIFTIAKNRFFKRLKNLNKVKWEALENAEDIEELPDIFNENTENDEALQKAFGKLSATDKDLLLNEKNLAPKSHAKSLGFSTMDSYNSSKSRAKNRFKNFFNGGK